MLRCLKTFQTDGAPRIPALFSPLLSLYLFLTPSGRRWGGGLVKGLIWTHLHFDETVQTFPHSVYIYLVFLLLLCFLEFGY